MASIVIGSAGTWGDVLPFIELGRRLRERGHRVSMAANALHHEWISRCGLKVRPLGKPIGIQEALQAPPAVPGWRPKTAEFQKSRVRFGDLAGQERDLLNACRGADALIAHSYLYAARRVHTCLELKWISVSLRPSQYNHYYHGPGYAPLPPANLNILASSDYFSEPNLGLLREGLLLTGFLFFDGAWAGWEPDDGLQAFVQDGEKPLVLCLGCMPDPDASQIVAYTIQTASALGLKLVIQPGWSTIPREKLRLADSSKVRMAGAVSHDWLFSRAAAVIHSGGIGLCARALRCGTPMLLLPRRADQRFNAFCITTLAAGAAMKPELLAAEDMTRMLAERLLTTECKNRAGIVSDDLRGVDGLEQACDLIERAL